jgi:hypothetical protein
MGGRDKGRGERVEAALRERSISGKGEEISQGTHERGIDVERSILHEKTTLKNDKSERLADDVMVIDILDKIHRFFKDDRRTLVDDKTMLEDNKRTFEDDKSERLLDDVSFIDLLNESHRLLKGRDDEMAIRR